MVALHDPPAMTIRGQAPAAVRTPSEQISWLGTEQLHGGEDCRTRCATRDDGNGDLNTVIRLRELIREPSCAIAQNALATLNRRDDRMLRLERLRSSEDDESAGDEGHACNSYGSWTRTERCRHMMRDVS